MGSYRIALEALCRRTNVKVALGRTILLNSGLPHALERERYTVPASTAASLLPLLRAAASAQRRLRRRPRRLLEAERVYFIRCGAFVKIGVAGSPRRRRALLQIANPVPLEVLFTLAGGYEHEAGLHARFAAQRERGEWFRIEGDLETFIEARMRSRDTQSHENPTHEALSDELREAMQEVAEQGQRLSA